MEADILGGDPYSKVRLLGINSIGADGYPVPGGHALPWLQDTPAADVTALWSPAFRDVVILDEDNVYVTSYNLGTNDLGTQANYDYLKALLLQVAGE
jgi:hypothetical protein